MHEKYHKWYSPHMSRNFEMLVFGHRGYPVVLFPTSRGRYYQNKDFGLIDAVAHLIDRGSVKIYCPDSVDELSWYNYDIHPADRVRTHMAYEKVITHDVIDLAMRETGCDRVALAGCSFGGYHAANLAFRHPDRVGHVISMSGAFDIKQFIHGYYDEDCYFNNPSDYLPNLNDTWYLEKIGQMGIILGTGEWDMCLEENRRLSGILAAKGIPHWLDVRKGAGHDWPWWKEMFQHYLTELNEVKHA